MNGAVSWVGQPTESTFGTAVRQRRLAAGLSQEELAAKSGLSVRAISDIERGRTGCPRRSSIDLLAQTLGVRAQDLVPAQAPPPGQAASTGDATGGKAEVAEMTSWGHVPPEWRRAGEQMGLRGRVAMAVTIVMEGEPPLRGLVPPAAPAGCDRERSAMPVRLYSGTRGAAARLAAKVIDDAEQELGPGGSRLLLAVLAKALTSHRGPAVSPVRAFPAS